MAAKAKLNYTFNNNSKSFKATPKDDEKDRIEVEIGDSKDSSEIYPQIKLMRWDNEVNASFRLKGFNNYSVNSDSSGINFVNGEKEVHIYDVQEDNNKSKFNNIRFVDLGSVDGIEASVIHELGRYTDNSPTFFIHSFSEEVVMLCGQSFLASEFLDMNKINVSLCRYLCKEVDREVMYFDSNTYWVGFQFDQDKYDRPRGIANLFEAAIKEHFQEKGIEIIRKGGRFYYKVGAVERKFCSMDTEEGNFSFYIRIQSVDREKFFGFSKQILIDDKIKYEIGGIKEIDSSFDLSMVKNIVVRFAQKMGCSVINGQLSDNEKGILRSKNSLLSSGSWINDGQRSDFDVEEEKEKRYLKLQRKYLNCEFEVILKEKPLTNVIDFSMETKGLKFFYQPELTQEEVNNGAYRPKNVVGSYAAYHSSEPLSVNGGKLYKTGKAFHIYRPKIIDSAGKEVWGILSVKDNVMSVTIPQDFLDSAVYPVRHAAGATFGFTDTGGTSHSELDDSLTGSKFEAPENGDVSSLTVWVDDVGTKATMKGVICDSSKTIISDGVGGNSPVGDNSLQELSSSYSTEPSVTGGADYYLMVTSTDSSWKMWYDAGSTGQGHRDTTNDYDSPTNPDGIDQDRKYSVYVTYTATGVAAAQPPALTLLKVG